MQIRVHLTVRSWASVIVVHPPEGIQEWQQIYYQMVWRTCSGTAFRRDNIQIYNTGPSIYKMLMKVLMMVLVVRFCSKLKWSGNLNNSGDFPGQATFDFFDFYLIAKSWIWRLNIVVKDILVNPWLKENL